MPAQHINFKALDGFHFYFIAVDQDGASRPGFSDMATLEVAREDDRDRPRINAVLMHMAQRPVLIAASVQLLQAARRVVGMLSASFQCGVQDAYIEVTRHWIGVARDHVFRDSSMREAAAMQDHLMGLESE